MSVYNDVIFKDFNLTPRAKQAYKDAYDIAKELDHKNINNLHVLYGCIKNSSSHLKSFLLSSGVTLKDEDMVDVILKAKEDNNDKFFVNDNSDLWHEEVTEAIKAANDVSNDLNQYYVGIEHIILGIINTSAYVFKSVDDFIINFKSFKRKLHDLLIEDMENSGSLDPSFEELIEQFDFIEEESQEDISSGGLMESNMPDFVTNLSQLYVDGKLPEIYGREKEINLLIETISKKNKCNAILTGEAGVGKTAIVEFLARKICQADVPTNLLGMEILSVDLGTMLAGTQYRGQFEQKLKSLLDVAKKNPHIILFFDEVHTIFGAGGNQEGGVDAANMLKPLLARGEIKCIGSTTSAEYEKIFKKDSAMKRRFFNIEIDEPSKEETKKILYNCKSKYEEFHNVKFSKPIIDCIVDLSDSLISHKRFPDKAFDIIDQVGSRVKIKNLKPGGEVLKSHDNLVNILCDEDVDVSEVKEKFNDFVKELKTINDERVANPTNIKKQDVLEVISEHGKVSIEQIKNSRRGFSSFLPRMLSEVFGQDQVIKKINDLLSCAKAGLTDEDKPLASMFFVGPTSVGKTYTAKKIAKNFFGNEKAMLHINMSELYDKTGMSKLIGSNSGYVGYEEGGLLTKFVRDNPNCVVLFDEVEKADPQVLNLLLHLLDEGYIEDNRHEKIDFSKAVVILTSNIGHAEANKKSMGFVQSDSHRSDSYNDSVKKNLKPELLARINEVMVFDDLCDSDLKRIISFELSKIKDKLTKKGVNIKFNKSCVDCVFDRIKESNLHARDIKNYIREKVQVPVAKIVVKNSKTSEINIKSVDNRIKVC